MRATLESSSKRGSFDRISSRQEFQSFENWKWEIENIFCIVCGLKESENHPFTSFKKLWVGGGGGGGGGWVNCDYSISIVTFVFELRLWEWNSEIWAVMSRSWAWQFYRKELTSISKCTFSGQIRKFYNIAYGILQFSTKFTFAV